MAPSAELIADVEQRRTDDREKEQTASERGMTESYSTFSTSQKWSVVCFCGLAGSFSTFSAFTYFPAVEDIADDLNVNLSLVYVSVTVYLVTQGVIPAFFGALADQIGRRPVYIVALALYVAACVGLALQRSYVALLALRVLQSAGCSATVALGVIVVSDIVPPHERGKFSGAMLMGPNTGPSIGPVIGGIVAEKLGWWWTFWMLAIFGTICLILFSLLFPETSRAVVGNGSNPAGWVNSPALSLLKPQTTKTKDPQLRAKLHSIPNPFNCVRLILRKEEALIMSNALFYMNYSVLQASLASLLINIYGLNSLEAGLCYLPYGVATLFSSYIVGLLMDRDYCAMAKQADISINRELGDDITKTPIEKARVRSIWLFMGAIFSATLGFGWSIQSRTHLSVPLIMSFVSGFCNNGVFNNCIVIMVDIHPREPGLASVSVSLVRCIAAAIGVSIYPPLLEAVGIGWTFSIFALFLTLTIPMMAVVRVKGPEWRGVTT